MIFSTLEHILTHISFSIVSIVITLHLITLLGNEIIKPYDSSEKGMIATFLCLTGLLTTRWIYSGHFPLSDLYESLYFLSWSFSLIHIVPYFKIRKNDLTTITASITIFTQGFATSGLLNEIHKPTILVPALQSEWLIMHVSMMILSYAALLCGSLISIVSGAVWANEAWGSHWSWDPKETWAFITWIVFAIYLHTRTNKNLQGANSTIVASLGFLIIWICYFGVNLLGIGLHSYGSFTLTYS
ncbi:Cytochrome c biogenesis protein CcsA [Helianthus annuus]|nr:Cytochrome c biogenesis protein CcsA [Helianthus annuus]